MKRKKILITIMLAMSMGYSHGQTTPGSTGQEDSHKPSASKGPVGEKVVNVDPFTGIGSVNIPIYDYTVDQLPFPVSLTYNAKGVLVDDLSSSVGLGFNLVAGSSITREVKNFEDEVSTNAYYAAINDYYTGWLVPGARPRTYADKYYDDKEADVFYINLAGVSYELTFTDSQGHYTTYPKSEIKVEVQTKSWNASTSSYTNIRSGIRANIGKGLDSNFLGFIITDEQGNRYYFERGDIRIKEYSLGSALTNNIGTYYAVEKWNLTKVITYGAQEVKFDYVSKYLEYVESVAEIVYTRVNKSHVMYQDSFLQIKPQYWKGYKSHISKITYPNNTTVSFDLDTNRADCMGNYRLRGIVIENKYNDNFKNKVAYRLSHGMFNTPKYGLTYKSYAGALPLPYNTTLSNTIPSGPKQDSLRKLHLERGLRMQLREIVKQGTDGISTKPYYSFGYDTTHALPYRFSAHKDFYGYYNGDVVYPYVTERINQQIDTYELSIPYHRDPNWGSYMPPREFPQQAPVEYEYYGKYRDENINYTSTFSLNKVTNGCGGIDSIVYKGDYILANPDSAYGTMTVPNNYVYTQSGYPGPPPYPPTEIDLGYDIDTLFEYRGTNDGLCISKVISKDGFNVDNDVTVEYSYSGGQRFNQGGVTWYYEQDTGIYYYKIFTNFNVTPNVYFRGSNHGFSEVTMTTKGYNNEQLSKTRLTFSNLVYKNANNKTVSCLSKPTKIKYQHIAPVMKKWRMGNVLKKETWDENGYLTSLATFDYDSTTGHTMLLRKDSMVTYIRDNSAATNRSMITVNKYRYDSNDNLVSSSNINSKGDTIIGYKRYNYDYSLSGTTLDTLNNRNRQFMLASYTWRKTPIDSFLLHADLITPKFTDAAFTRLKFFSTFNSNINTPLTPPEVNSGLPTFAITYNGSGWTVNTASNLEKTKEVTKYDTAGNAIESKGKVGNEYDSRIWDIANGTLLADVTNASYSNIAFTSFESSYSGLGTSDYGKGNWDFNPSSIHEYTAASTFAISGNYVYQITTTNNIVGKPLENRKYVLSFWVSDSTVKPSVRLYSGASHISTLSYTNSTNQVNGWVLYTFHFTPAAGQHIRLVSSGSNVYIDNVRMHPRGAMMQSYTYSPLFGISSVTSTNNYIQYCEYDMFGSPSTLRDMRGNIIKAMYSKCHFDDVDETANYDWEGADEPAY